MFVLVFICVFLVVQFVQALRTTKLTAIATFFFCFSSSYPCYPCSSHAFFLPPQSCFSFLFFSSYQTCLYFCFYPHRLKSTADASSLVPAKNEAASLLFLLLPSRDLDLFRSFFFFFFLAFFASFFSFSSFFFISYLLRAAIGVSASSSESLLQLLMSNTNSFSH